MTHSLKPIVSGVAVAIFIVAMSASVSAKGGGGSSTSNKPGHPPPPVFLEGSSAGRAVGSSCSISRRPVVNASGAVTGYRRVQVCN